MSNNREFTIKDFKFIITEGKGDLYEVKAWHNSFNSYATFAKVFTLDKCREYAEDFVNKGGWEGWMV